ncbi:unnamed protein product [Sympodiomycopsis kandeliae]
MSDSRRPRSYLLPYTTLQPTYAEVHSDILSNKVTAENVWLSVYSDNAPQKSIHATLVLRAKEKDNVAEQDQVVTEVTKGGNLLKLISQASDQVSDLTVQTTSAPSSSSLSPITLQNGPTLPPTTLRIPIETRTALLKGRRSERALESGGGGQISAFDISPDGQYFIAGGEDGEAVIGQQQLRSRSDSKEDTTSLTIEEKAQRRMQSLQSSRLTPLKGHLGDIRCAKFFPSGQVALTSSSDLTLRLWSLQGVNPRTFKGHKRAITNISILSRGKRFLSASLDGTIKSWDVAAEKCLRTIAVRRMSGVESLSVVRLSENDSEEDGMGKYILFAGLSSGWTDVISLQLNLLEPSKPSTEEGEQPIPARIEIIDKALESIPPVDYPTDLPEGVSQPGATDFWSITTTGSVWALDAQLSVDSGAINLIMGTKSGVVRYHTVDLSVLSQIEQTKQSQRQAEDQPQQQEEDTITLAAPTSYSESLNFKRNACGITALRWLNASDVLVTTSDGTPYRVHLADGVPLVTEEYTGWEAGDSVDGIGVCGDKVMLAGAEGCLRYYHA